MYGLNTLSDKSNRSWYFSCSDEEFKLQCWSNVESSVGPLQSAHGKGDALSGQRSPELKKKNKSEETDKKKDVPPERYLETGL